MERKMILICGVALALASCDQVNSEKESSANVSGTYVREYVTEVKNPETGTMIGTRQIRDSIFIKAISGGYHISNRKWRLNDYDHNGWVSLGHGDDRPMATFLATYDQGTRRFNQQKEIVPYSLHISGSNLLKGDVNPVRYTKIR